MTLTQQIITIVMVVLGTMITRFLPFIVFNSDKPTPSYIVYLGRVLPAATFALLIIYCLKDVNVLTYAYGLPELIAIVATVLVHLWKRNMLISIASGTIIYMCLIQLIF